MQRRPNIAHVKPLSETLMLLVLVSGFSTRGADGTPGARGLPYDLSKVRGIEVIPREEHIRARLAANGFVVLPREHRQIFGPYAEFVRDGPYIPPFVTLDSAMRTYQVILTESFRVLEIAQAPRLAAVSARLLADIRAHALDGAPWRDAMERLEAWAAVGLRLQDEKAGFDALSEGARALAAREWAALAKGAPTESAIFGRARQSAEGRRGDATWECGGVARARNR